MRGTSHVYHLEFVILFTVEKAGRFERHLKASSCLHHRELVNMKKIDLSILDLDGL